MSDQHREALAHLTYGVQQDGGFILLTGEVGTGKTTVCRCFLKQLDDHIDVAYIVNPKQTALELLESMCDDLGIARVEDDVSIKSLTDMITGRLLSNHAAGKNTVLLIDEAQNLSVDVLEQLRLLTNLETDQKKLLQIILLGQPELLDLLARPELRQLSQRVTARFHMGRLDRKDIIPYVRHRLAVAGCRMALFPDSTAKIIEKASGGVPRLINLICDRTLLGVYSSNGNSATVKILRKAAKEVLGEQKGETSYSYLNLKTLLGGVVVLQLAIMLYWFGSSLGTQKAEKLVSVTKAELQPVAPYVAADAITMANELEQDVLEALFNTKAYTGLGRLWGINGLPNQWRQLCETLSTTRVSCGIKNIDVTALGKMNRPFVASMLFQGRIEEILVSGMSDAGDFSVVINSDLTEKVITKDVFEQLWTGKVHYLWLKPEVNDVLLKPGDVHPYIQQVRNFLVDKGEGIDSDLYDQALSQQVKAFQRRSGVDSDGVIGPETIMLLNTFIEPVPVLNDMNRKTKRADSTAKESQEQLSVVNGEQG
ncbi:ExeA family protein [Litoribacillus peritrichatus]